VVVVETTEAAVEATSVVVVEAEGASMVVATEVEEAFEAAVAATEAAAVIEVAAATEEVVAFVAVTEVASAVDVEGLRAPRSLGKFIWEPNFRLITNLTSQWRHQHSAARC
jgi:hypothetical protein